MAVTFALTLPPNYPTEHVLGYHQRDAWQLSEKRDGQTLQKAFMLQGTPTLLALDFSAQRVSVRMDSPHESAQTAMATHTVQRMLGLAQDVDAFEQAYHDHPVIGAVIQRQSGLRVAATVTPFEALAWAIIGQQISVSAAVAIRRRLIKTAGQTHDSGLWCHPGPTDILATTPEQLRAAGLSNAKTQTLLHVSRAVDTGALPLDEWLEEDTADWEARRAALQSIRGVGPWTADYTLLRGYGWLDGSLHGDAAVRRSLGLLLESEQPLSQQFARTWLEPFTPWRALVGAHLWAANRIQA